MKTLAAIWRRPSVKCDAVELECRLTHMRKKGE